MTSSGEDRIYVFNVKEDRLLTTIDVGIVPKGVKISPDEKTALVANEGSGTVSVIDLDALSVEDEILVGPVPHNIVYSSDSRYA